MAAPKSMKVNSNLLAEISKSLESVGGWGSVEIFIQDYKVTQITKRNITKTSHDLKLSVDRQGLKI